MNHNELVERTRAVTLTSWTAQSSWKPLSMSRAEGVYFWDADDKRYLDWSSQLFNVNVGHQHPHVVKAIQEQAATLCYASPSLVTEARARLAELIKEVTPHDLAKTFFTTGGSDGIENAMKIARMSSGRQKIVTRYRSYHGATFGAMTAGGDPRRLANEPGVPWIVRVQDPDAYHSPFYAGRTVEEGDRIAADLMEDVILMEGPGNIAAILLEGYNGTSGVIQGGEAYWKRVQEICDHYGILLIIDEVLSGFGRTGEWFGIDHYPFVKPDLMVMAKGLTSGYLPLGAVTVTEKVASYFDEHTLYAGLTYSAHALACAAGVANIEVYRNEGLIENARKMGKVLRAGLTDLAEKHDCIGDIRGTGLQQVIELVKNRETRQPMSGFNRPQSEAMGKVAASLKAQGVNAFVKWDWVFCMPPLVINEAQIQEGLEKLDAALALADAYME